jgi:hypothetical protein
LEQYKGLHASFADVFGKRDSLMNIRRPVLDVDKTIARPSLIELAEAIERACWLKGKPTEDELLK